MRFTWDDVWDAWTAAVVLPSWAGYRDRSGPYGGPGPAGTSDGTVTLVFAPEGRDDRPLAEQDIASADWLLANESAVAAAVVAALLQSPDRHLADRKGRVGGTGIRTIADLKTRIGLHTVHIHPIAKDGLPYLGFEFGSGWDEEHGLGVLMHGLRCVSIGGSDTALLLWIAQEDAGQG